MWFYWSPITRLSSHEFTGIPTSHGRNFWFRWDFSTFEGSLKRGDSPLSIEVLYVDRRLLKLKIELKTCFKLKSELSDELEKNLWLKCLILSPSTRKTSQTRPVLSYVFIFFGFCIFPWFHVQNSRLFPWKLVKKYHGNLCLKTMEILYNLGYFSLVTCS